jgi:DNA-binding NtrC family response regulator
MLTFPANFSFSPREAARDKSHSGHCRQAMDMFKPGIFDVVVSDIRMQSVDGMQLLRYLKSRQSDIPVILVTGYAQINSAAEAFELGVSDYRAKPVPFCRFPRIFHADIQ